MEADTPTRYLAALPEDQRATLQRINRRGLSDLRTHLASGKAVAFLGAGASAPLYQLWAEMISEVVEYSSDVLTEQEAATFRAQAKREPDVVVELIRQRIGPTEFREVLWRLFRVRHDPNTGKTWTPTHELVVRCNFAGIVTTNYDPGIVNARMAVRPTAEAMGYSSYTDDHMMDRWRTLDVFGDAELPVLFAHGHHNQPENIVLATAEYRRAYRDKLARVLGRLFDTAHIVWIGFSFADKQIAAILQHVSEWSGTRIDPGQIPRHIAIMPWIPPSGAADSAVENDPQFVRSLAHMQYGARLILFPAPGGDYSALDRLLEELIDPQFAAAPASLASSALLRPTSILTAETATPASMGVPRTWMDGAVPPKQRGESTTQPAHIDQYAGIGMLVERPLAQAAKTGRAGRLQDHNQALVAMAEALNRDRARRIVRVFSAVQARQDAVEQSLAGLSDQIKNLEAHTSERLRAQAAALQGELQEAKGKIIAEAHRTPDKQDERWRARLAQERHDRTRDLAGRADELAKMCVDREGALRAARLLVNDARLLASSIANSLPHEPLAPGRLAALQQRLLSAEANLGNRFGEAALAQAQDLCLELGDLRAEVEIRDQEWSVAQITAMSATMVLLEQIRLNRSIDVADEYGNRIEAAAPDVDFWSGGELDELRTKAEALAEQATAGIDSVTVEDLHAITGRDIPSLDNQLTEIVRRADAQLFASQFRVNLAELVVGILEETTGYVWEGQATFAGEDPRQAFYSKLRHPDDSELIVEVTPYGDSQSCRLSIISFDADVPDEEERVRRAHAIVEQLRDRGLPVGDPAAGLTAPDPAVADFERLRRVVPTLAMPAPQTKANPGVGEDPRLS